MFLRTLFLILATSLLVVPVISNASSRGLSVNLKASEARGAELLAESILYSNSYALVIGIDNYVDGWPRLSNAVEDSNKIALALGQRGFDVTQLNNLDGRDLEDALEDFFIDKGADPEARLFVWYAGHGHTMDGEGFLVPADGVLPGDRKQFLRRATSLRRFSEFVRLAESKHVFTVFDSCFAGTIFNVARSAPPPAITRVTTKPVRQFLSSGDAGQTVSDDGTFAQLFVEALAGERRADLNQDGYLTAEEIGSFLTNKISNYTNNKQIPRHGKLRDPRFDQGDFVFKSYIRDAEGGVALSSQALSKNLTSADHSRASFSLDDLNSEGDRWMKYQSDMNSALKQIQVFEQTHGNEADRPLVSAAWKKLLTAFSEDNPYSKDDEKIRLAAQQRVDALNPRFVVRDKTKIQPLTIQDGRLEFNGGIPSLLNSGFRIGDVLLSVNGLRVASRSAVRDTLKANQSNGFVILRGGSEYRISTNVSKQDIDLMTADTIALYKKPEGLDAREMFPIVKVLPRYPLQMARDGMQGWVLAEFTVNKNGGTENVKVIENCAWIPSAGVTADCVGSPHRGFDRAAIKAVRKYKFKPKIVDGEAINVDGVRNSLNFTLQ